VQNFDPEAREIIDVERQNPYFVPDLCNEKALTIDPSARKPLCYFFGATAPSGKVLSKALRNSSVASSFLFTLSFSPSYSPNRSAVAIFFAT
jgi:hypothetical protein